MKRENKQPKIAQGKAKAANYPGYPEYSSMEDIYLKAREASDIDPEEIPEKDEFSFFGKEYGDDSWEDETFIKHDLRESEYDDEPEIIENDDDGNDYYSSDIKSSDDLEDLID